MSQSSKRSLVWVGVVVAVSLLGCVGMAVIGIGSAGLLSFRRATEERAAAQAEHAAREAELAAEERALAQEQARAQAEQRALEAQRQVARQGGFREPADSDEDVGLRALGPIGRRAGGAPDNGTAPPGRPDPAGADARVRFGNEDVRGSLSRDIIRRVVRRNQSQLRSCYQRELRRVPTLEGRVTMSFVISRTGEVQNPRVAQSTLESPAVESCLEMTVRRWRFPEPNGGGIVVVNYPFVFSTAS